MKGGKVQWDSVSCLAKGNIPDAKPLSKPIKQSENLVWYNPTACSGKEATALCKMQNKSLVPSCCSPSAQT